MAAAEPSTTAELGLVIHRLSLHYPDRKLSAQEAAEVAKDWLEDLEGLPLDIVELAFKRWRTGHKCAFFPKAGEILGLVKEEIGVRKMLAKRAIEITEGMRA